MNRNPIALASLAILFAGAAAIAPHSFAAPTSGAKKTARVSTSTSLVPDKGTFKIIAGGKEAGREEFQIEPSGNGWTIEGKATLQSAKGAAHVNGTLELNADGSPARYVWSVDGDKKAAATVVFNGASASIALSLPGAQPYSQQFSFQAQPIAVLDNNLYDQYAVLAGLYDWSKKGVQTFSVLVPQEMTPGSLTVESLGQQESNGKSMDELRVKTEDLEVDLFLDKGHLMRIAVPGADAEIVRQ